MTLVELNQMIDNNKIDFELVNKEANESNDDELLVNIGIYYRLGAKGFPKDFEKSFKYLLKSANLGNSRAMYYVGWLYKTGYGCEKNLELSTKWYQKGAELNDINCIQAIAEAYLSGDGVEANRNKAFEWYQKGAELGNGSCIRALMKYFKIDYFNDGNI